MKLLQNMIIVFIIVIENDYKYVDYYDWHFTYIGHDGNTYNYIEKNQSFEPDKEYTTKIYVDENDDSHSLAIKSYKHSSFAKKDSYTHCNYSIFCCIFY